jgi:hypothetical protein
MSRSSLCLLRDQSVAVRRSSPDVAGRCSRSRGVARVSDDAHRAAGKSADGHHISHKTCPPHDLTSNSLSPMLDVLVKELGTHTLEHLAGAPLQIER